MILKTFEDLQNLGIEKIHEKTHIARDKIALVLTKSFTQIGKVQFMGYISILEREYFLDLNDIRQEYLQFYHENPDTRTLKQSTILYKTPNSKSKWIIVGIILILLLMIGGYFIQVKMSAQPIEPVLKLVTASVEVVEELQDTNSTETNESNGTSLVLKDDVNLSLAAEDSSILLSGKQMTIRPAYKLWYGMIDIQNKERIQGITTKSFSIDPSKNWLIFLGHGRVEIEADGKKVVLKGKETVRLLAQNGVIKEISREEFISRNGGRNW